MPKLDGYQLSQTIRDEENGTRRVPIVALTANALKGEAEQCRAAGMDDYLSKPSPLAALKITLEKWLPVTDSAMEPVTVSAVTVANITVSTPVDVSVLEGFVGKDPTVIREFLHDFHLSSKQLTAEISAACENGYAAQAGAAAHKLKSAARAVGALALGELCDTMEQKSAAGDTQSLIALLPRFMAEMAAIDEYLSSLEC